MNSLLFNGNNYLQTHATAMGTQMTSSFTNWFMGKLEHEFLLTQDVKPQDWWRFIDDIFAIWTHGKLMLRTFIESLNCHHPIIRFTTTWSAGKLILVNKAAYLENDQIRTDLRVKPMDKDQYL